MHDILGSAGRPGYQPSFGYLNLGENKHPSAIIPMLGINYQFITPLRAQAQSDGVTPEPAGWRLALNS
jgi:hypothetical protein